MPWCMTVNGINSMELANEGWKLTEWMLYKCVVTVLQNWRSGMKARRLTWKIASFFSTWTLVCLLGICMHRDISIYSGTKTRLPKNTKSYIMYVRGPKSQHQIEWRFNKKYGVLKKSLFAYFLPSFDLMGPNTINVICHWFCQYKPLKRWQLLLEDIGTS